MKYTEPVDLSKIAPLPDFLLIPKDEENSFCKVGVEMNFISNISFFLQYKTICLRLISNDLSYCLSKKSRYLFLKKVKSNIFSLFSSQFVS